MSFAEVDAVLPEWLARHGLHLLTRDRDDEVRAIPVIDDQGCQYVIWFAQRDGQWELHASGLPSHVWSQTYSVPGLPLGLEETWTVVEDWISDDGHSRRPFLDQGSS